MASKPLLTEAEEQHIVAAIGEAEALTSGEIRVHIEKKCSSDDPIDRAIEVFEKLGMSNTEHKNGVLIYIATEHKRFAIIGDKGINEKVPEDFWESVRTEMAGHFAAKRLAEGIAAGALAAGEKLKIHFPHQQDDSNELSNDISLGND